jgi:osmotically-inducible protein OsmY
MTHDDQLQKAVLAELKWEPSITAAHIGVTAENGTVTLSGHVQSYGQKHAAEIATGRVKGVKAVAEEIEVRLRSRSSATMPISPPLRLIGLPGTRALRKTR